MPAMARSNPRTMRVFVRFADAAMPNTKLKNRFYLYIYFVVVICTINSWSSRDCNEVEIPPRLIRVLTDETVRGLPGFEPGSDAPQAPVIPGYTTAPNIILYSIY